ncbi:GTPase IMAP family member 7-like [Physella acuta]|uniref:GTPase IMAP family member 7-like n=1 Tax=Physella acuta TaxID=109671 RepID=UPI0027DAF598|nr:GTPase IMAP family member 7-like [Physella acuta]
MDNSRGIHQLNIVLVGRSGNGKTSTIQSLLASQKSKTDLGRIVKYEGVMNNVKILALECKYVGDSGDDLPESFNVEESASEVLQLCNNSCHVFVFVLRYGVRFTQQEKDAVVMVKRVFGQSVLKNYGIVVLTYGDNFTDNGESNFEDWLKDQRGGFRDLLREVNDRCVLFDNKLSGNMMDVVKKEQARKLQDIITKLCTTKGYIPYNENLLQNEKLRQKAEHLINGADEKLALSSKGPSKNGASNDDMRQQLESIWDEIEQLLDEVRQKPGFTHVIQSLEEKRRQVCERREMFTTRKSYYWCLRWCSCCCRCCSCCSCCLRFQ